MQILSSPTLALPRALLVAQLSSSIEIHLIASPQVNIVALQTSIPITRLALHRDQVATIVINRDFDAWPLIMLTINAPNLEPQALMLLDFVAPIVVTVVVPLVTNCLSVIVNRFEAAMAAEVTKLDTTLDAD